ncbi:MAG TPA: transporter associated domain-containing protein [Thiobacillus sp.]|nr:transporter associated domain-containing protein [Thiobacillus sp.]
MSNVAAQYGLPLPPEMSDLTLEAFITRKLPGVPVVGDRVRRGKLEFVVRAIVDGRIRQVGLRIPTHLVDAP